MPDDSLCHSCLSPEKKNRFFQGEVAVAKSGLMDNNFDGSLRLAFTNDGVVVGVIGWYDLVVEIKPKESEAEHRFRYVAYNLVKTASSESQAEAEEQTSHNVRFRALRLVGSSAFASDFNNLVVTGSYATES